MEENESIWLSLKVGIQEMLSELSRNVQFYLNSNSAVTAWVVTVVCIVVTLLLVFVFVALGWWLVWICFLSRFKFVRELIQYNSTPPSTDTHESSSAATTRKPSKAARRRATHYD